MAVLQRFYHQQIQLKEKNANLELINQYPTRPVQQFHEPADIKNSLLRHIPKFRQKLNPFKNTSEINTINASESSNQFYGSTAYNLQQQHESLYNKSVYKKHERSTTLPPSTTHCYANQCNYGFASTDNALRSRIPTLTHTSNSKKTNLRCNPNTNDLRNDYASRNYLRHINSSPVNSKDDQGKFIAVYIIYFLDV